MLFLTVLTVYIFDLSDKPLLHYVIDVLFCQLYQQSKTPKAFSLSLYKIDKSANFNRTQEDYNCLFKFIHPPWPVGLHQILGFLHLPNP